MSLASKLKNTASTLLTKYGQSVTVTTFSGTYNPFTGDVGSTSTTTYTGVGYPSRYTSKDIDGVVIRQTDTLLIFSSDTQPQINEVFTVGSVSMTALDVQIISVSGSDLVYKIQLRQ